MKHPLFVSALAFFALGLLSRVVIRHHESRLQIVALMGVALVAEGFAPPLFGRAPSFVGIFTSAICCVAGVILMRWSIEGLSHG
ncbi:hypothetical protein Q4F19_16830 [Sphingomonas sp. BIUV-7]|uniref:Uncharacterized protein n=1 Tax=Sphingomonas natans TaxID=3063330 RepID=A0ABT8YCI0_9SPHN|nr:hypothetical protein [Sphingomonas sp. BIUV-7]MDO6416056.1 hypothetical protein [Sphingomonas sp. BIUV-7]